MRELGWCVVLTKPPPLVRLVLCALFALLPDRPVYTSSFRTSFQQPFPVLDPASRSFLGTRCLPRTTVNDRIVN